MINALKNIDGVSRGLLIFIFALLPIDNKVLSPLLICLILVVLISFKMEVFSENFKRLRKFYFPFILLFFVLAITIFWTENVSAGMRGIERRLLLIFAPFIFLCIEKSNIRTKILFKIYMLSTLLITSFFIVYGILNYANIYSPSIKYPFYAFLFVFSTILEDFDVHRSYFSVSVLISLLIVLNDIFRFKIFQKVILGIFFSFSVLMFQSKAAIFILLSILIVYWLKFIRGGNWKQKIMAIAIAIIVFLITASIVQKRFDTMISKLNNIDLIGGKGSTIERIQYYHSATKLIKKEPYLGYGIGDVKDVMMVQINESGYLNLISKSQGDPHNEFFKVFLIAGIIGFLVFLYLFYVLFRYSIVHKNYLLLAVSWIFFCSCLVESYLSRQGGIIPFLMFSCLLIKMNKRSIKS